MTLTWVCTTLRKCLFSTDLSATKNRPTPLYFRKTSYFLTMLHNYLILKRKLRKKTFYITPLFSYILTLPFLFFLTLANFTKPYPKPLTTIYNFFTPSLLTFLNIVV